MISDDPVEAMRWVRAGDTGVLIADVPLRGLAEVPAATRRSDPVVDVLVAVGPGRVGLLVGDPGDAEARRWADVMDAELFRPRAAP